MIWAGTGAVARATMTRADPTSTNRARRKADHHSRAKDLRPGASSPGPADPPPEAPRPDTDLAARSASRTKLAAVRRKQEATPPRSADISSRSFRVPIAIAP